MHGACCTYLSKLPLSFWATSGFRSGGAWELSPYHLHPYVLQETVEKLGLEKNLVLMSSFGSLQQPLGLLYLEAFWLATFIEATVFACHPAHLLRAPTVLLGSDRFLIASLKHMSQRMGPVRLVWKLSRFVRWHCLSVL